MAFLRVDIEKTKSETFTHSSTERERFYVGFKPKLLIITKANEGYSNTMIIYDETYSTTKFRYAAGSTYASDVNLGSSTNNHLYSIDNYGFTLNKAASTGYVEKYIAIG